MAQELQSITITAPGFAGINTQDAPLSQEPTFAAVADNCIIDKSGRIAARKGYTQLNGNDLLGSSNGVEALQEFTAIDGTEAVISAGNNLLFTGTTTMVDATPVGLTVTANNWKMTEFNDHMYMFQSGHEPCVYSADTGAITTIANDPAVSGTPPEGNECLAAFGRLWVTDVAANKSIIYWSDFLNGAGWGGGSSGSIDLTRVWPTGYDVVVSLAAHNGFLVIFGRNSIIIYANADSPSTMELSDTISNIGAVSRDAVVSTGKDLIFLDDSGLRSLSRTIQEKSAPIGDVSKNVNNDVKLITLGETGNIKMHYSPIEAFVLLNYPTLGIAYCFDTRFPLQDGSSRVTTWTGFGAKSFTNTDNDEMYIGNADGIAEYTSYRDNAASYELSYFSHPLAFGSTDKLKFLKKINLTTFDGAEGVVRLNWAYDYSGAYLKTAFTLPANNVGQYNRDEYNTAAEYSSSFSLVNRQKVNTSGHGTVVQIGVETTVDGKPIAIQELNIHALLGRIV